MPRKKAMKKQTKTKTMRTKSVQADLFSEHVIAEDDNQSRALYDSSCIGEPKDGKFHYSLVEVAYLIESKKMTLKDGRKTMKFDAFVQFASKHKPSFWICYVVYRDLKNRGYVVKTALKFGADFRVYDRGVKPGEDHARWIAYPVHESQALTWHEFSAKNRVAHSTRKRLLLAIVDDENDVSYWESAWKRP